VVVTTQVQHAVDNGLAQIVGVLGTDHHIAQLARTHGGARLVDRKGQHVRGSVACPVAAVELANASLVDEGDRQVPVLDPRRCQRGERGIAQLGRSVDEIELDYQTCRRIGGRRAGACFSAYSL
jgi:hypothetical protein